MFLYYSVESNGSDPRSFEIFWFGPGGLPVGSFKSFSLNDCHKIKGKRNINFVKGIIF